MAFAPRIVQLSGGAADPVLLAEAAAIIRRGGLVAFPTETVYGLAADATNPKAIERLNQVKGRPPEKPYSIHLHSTAQVHAFVTTIPPLAAKLMERFWPGPLTIVMPSKEGKTVGFRLPNHPVASAFLKACGVPVVAPSANRSGSPPPTDANEVLEALNGSFDCLLDAGPTPMGRESTVVEVIDGRIEIRRVGAIDAASILAAVKD
jgi:L-threonylcarbamoyladenylate synthase